MSEEKNIEKKDEAKKQRKPEKTIVRNYIRIANADLNSSLRVAYALKGIKGISFSVVKAVCRKTGIDPNRKTSELTKEEIKSIEEFLQKPDMPSWMKNRRKDPESGEDMHLTMADLDLKKRDDINSLRRIRAYKGIRHELGQPVRGQRTRSSFRTQKTVGVSRKNIQQAAKAKPKEEKKK